MAYPHLLKWEFLKDVLGKYFLLVELLISPASSKAHGFPFHQRVWAASPRDALGTFVPHRVPFNPTNS